MLQTLLTPKSVDWVSKAVHQAVLSLQTLENQFSKETQSLALQKRKGLWHDRVWERPNTPPYLGVFTHFRFFILYLVGIFQARPELIPVYLIYAARGSSLCKFESNGMASGC